MLNMFRGALAALLLFVAGSAVAQDRMGGRTPALSSAAIAAGLGYTPANKAGDTFTGAILGAVGSVSAPGFSFSGDADTGVYRAAADSVGVAGAGVDVAKFIGVASGVNYVQFRATTTTNFPMLEWNGSDSNVGAFYVTKGTGYHDFRTGGDGAGSTGALQMRVDHVAGANRLVIIKGSNGGNPNIDTSNGSLTLSSGGALAATFSSTAATLAGTVATSAPTGGAGAWLLGIANSVSPTSPNRTITVSIGGTLYYIHAKTTND